MRAVVALRSTEDARVRDALAVDTDTAGGEPFYADGVEPAEGARRLTDDPRPGRVLYDKGCVGVGRREERLTDPGVRVVDTQVLATLGRARRMHAPAIVIAAPGRADHLFAIWLRRLVIAARRRRPLRPPPAG